MSWMRLPEEYRTERSTFLILPIPYEERPTFGTGARHGAATIIKASEHLEYYDEQFDCEPFLHGISVLPEATSLEEVERAVRNVTKEKFLLGLGGDHAVTTALVQGFEALHDNFSVLILDAHSDFRESWNGSRDNHACVARRIVGKHKVAVLGVRAQDVDEAKDAKQNENVRIVKAYEYDENALEKVLDFLDEKVYVSLDVDVFDPSFIRNTGTPEPGGFDWQTAIAILEQVFKSKSVIGADIVEFAPQGEEWNYRAEAYALARLAYKLMALFAKNNL